MLSPRVLLLLIAGAAVAEKETTISTLREDLPKTAGPILRSLLLVDVAEPANLPQSWDPLYVTYDDGRAYDFWNLEKTSIVLDPSDPSLPFAAFAVDALVLDVAAPRFESLSDDEQIRFLVECARVVAADGVVVLVGAEKRPVVALEGGAHVAADLCSPPAHAAKCGGDDKKRCVALDELLLKVDGFTNVYRRGKASASCEKTTPKGAVCPRFPATPEGYQTIGNSRRQQAVGGDVNKGRLAGWDSKGMLDTYGPTSWAGTYARKSPTAWRDNYVTPHAKKKEWRTQFTKWIEAGYVKRVLDAGAGTCSLDATLRSSGARKSLTSLVSFGFYDCSMARVAAERGSPILDWTWLAWLPLCSRCKFELIFQAEGIHHTSLSIDTSSDLGLCDEDSNKAALASPFRRLDAEDSNAAAALAPPFRNETRRLRGRHGKGQKHNSKYGDAQLSQSSNRLPCALVLWRRAFDNFDRHLACGGILFLSDSDDQIALPSNAKPSTPQCWMAYGIQWAEHRGYEVKEVKHAYGSLCGGERGARHLGHSELLVKKTCKRA